MTAQLMILRPSFVFLLFTYSSRGPLFIDQTFFEQPSAGFAETGDRIIIVAGVPFGTPGATNMVRIAYIDA